MFENVAAIAEEYRARKRFEDTLAQDKNYEAYCKAHDEIRRDTLKKINDYVYKP